MVKAFVELLKKLIVRFSKKRVDNSASIEAAKSNVKYVELPIQEALAIVESNIKNLVSPLGEFHWRGLRHPDKAHISNGAFHANEQGDATLHTGVLLTALCWKFKHSGDSETLNFIDKILSYFELHQEFNNGGLGRNFIKEEFYNQFPIGEKDGSVNKKSHMRYRAVKINGETYFQRYDFSVDALTHAICGIYWAFSLVPQYKNRAKKILGDLYSFLEACDWNLKDTNGETMRYSNISPKINFFSRLNEIILKKVIGSKAPLTAIDKTLLNNVPSYVKDSDIHYFNSFIDTTQMLVLHDLKVNVKGRLEILKKEFEGVENLFFNAVYNVVNKTNLETARNREKWILNSGHPFGKIRHNDNVPMSLRTGYCKWEFPPFISCVGKSGDEVTGNADLLLAYWIG